ncbi:MAG: hypothetical protein NT038_02495 [Euryarchaeota archaeon]|nr:hypothetical protein [Euryarchaeota archaeon]
MTRANYKELNIHVPSFHKAFLDYAKKAGWQVKDEVYDQVTATFTIKKGLLNTSIIKARGNAQDLVVEMIGASTVMDLVEQAIAANCDKPTSIVGWREQMRLQPPAPQQTMPQQAPPSQAPAPIPTPQSIVKPPVPKLEACLHCGAPVNYNPEEYLIICDYCGFINNPSGEQPPRHSMLPICFAGTQAIDIAKNHVAKGILITKGMANQAEWGSIVLRYVPNWAVTMQLRGSVQGERALIKTKDTKSQVAQDVAMHAIGGVLGGILGKSVGKNIANRSEYNSINEALDVFVVARRAAAFQPDVGAQKIPLDKKEPFQKTGEETLNVEFTPAEAREKAKGLAINDVRARYMSVSSFSVMATPVGEPELIYSPWWFIEYRMGGVSFSLIVDACAGNVIAGKRPWLPKGTTKKEVKT